MPPHLSAGSPQTELFADLYELRMAHAYHELGMRHEGVEDLIDMLAALRFGPDSLDYLRSLGEFPDAFLDWLAGFRFSGTVHAMPEGTPVFAEEPLLEVVAPIAEAQMIETLAMNVVGLQTLLASKASRVVTAATGRPVVDFGSRRAQGLDAAVAGARAFLIAGVAATSNLLAGARYGTPVAGTMAHSFIQAFDSEAEAFRAFARLHPETVLLVDTYDTSEGVRRVVALAQELGDAFRIRGVRIDSGNLLALSREARAILDEAGLRQVQVFASGGLNEEKIAGLLEDGAPVDAFGVGTEMSVSGDAPALDLAYKLTSYAGIGRTKLSAGKRILPGRKQVFRRIADGVAIGDIIARGEEDLAGRPLLRPIMQAGRRLHTRPSLDEARVQAAAELAALPARLRALQPADPPYPVTISAALAVEERAVRARVAGNSR